MRMIEYLAILLIVAATPAWLGWVEYPTADWLRWGAAIGGVALIAIGCQGDRT